MTNYHMSAAFLKIAARAVVVTIFTLGVLFVGSIKNTQLASAHLFEPESDLLHVKEFFNKALPLWVSDSIPQFSNPNEINNDDLLNLLVMSDFTPKTQDQNEHWIQYIAAEDVEKTAITIFGPDIKQVHHEGVHLFMYDSDNRLYSTRPVGGGIPRTEVHIMDIRETETEYIVDAVHAFHSFNLYDMFDDPDLGIDIYDDLGNYVVTLADFDDDYSAYLPSMPVRRYILTKSSSGDYYFSQSMILDASTPGGTQLISNLKVGDRVVDPSWEWEHRLGQYYSDTDRFDNPTPPGEIKPVTWIVVAKDHYGFGSGITLLAEEVIARFPFDNSTGRIPGQTYHSGYNHWGESGTANATHGLRPWLNSSGIHSGEGFYLAFSDTFKAAVVTVSVPNRHWETGATYLTSDRVFIPSTTELGDTKHLETHRIGTVYPYFFGASDADRIAGISGISTWYWARSPGLDRIGSIGMINGDLKGRIGTFHADDSRSGPRPSLNLKSNTQVSAVPNVDGVYVILNGEAIDKITVSVSASPSVGGTVTVSGDGTFNAGGVATVTAVANKGYIFMNWTENGTVISHKASYSFTVEMSRTLVANFEKGTHRVAYIPVKYPAAHSPSWQKKPDNDVDVLKYKAEMVEKLFKLQTYGEVEIVSDFIYDDWETFTEDEMKKIFEKAGVSTIPRDWRSDHGKSFSYAVLEVAIDKAFIDDSDKSTYDQGAIVVVNPIGGSYMYFLKEYSWPSFNRAYTNIVWTSDRRSYGVWAHELGHAIFDWWDYYGAEKDLTHGYIWTLGDVGYWGLMGSGTQIDPPAPIMSHHRVKMGWLNYRDLKVGSKQSIKLLHKTELGDTVYRYQPDYSYHPDIDYDIEYFIIEGRHPPDGMGHMKDNYWNPLPFTGLKKNEGIALYEVIPLEHKTWGKQDFVFYIPYHRVIEDKNRVSLDPSAIFGGNSYKCVKSEAEFIATRENSILNIEVKEYKPRNKRFIYIDYGYPIYYAASPVDPILLSQIDQGGFGNTDMPSLLNDPLSETAFDFHLNVYCEDGRLVGFDAETGEYRIEIEGALASGSRGGGGPEWIAVPDDVEVTYMIDTTPAKEWMEETGIDKISFEVEVKTEAIDDTGERTTTDEVTIKIALVNITLSANPEDGGKVSGGGVFEPGEEVTLMATANEGYKFVNWTENGEEVSTEAQFTFIVESDRDMTANFAFEEIKPGDVNNDGRVDVNDVVLVMRHALELHILKGDQLKAADVTMDGRIDVEDVVLIMRKSLGLIDSF